jgi:hypothetical protein
MASFNLHTLSLTTQNTNSYSFVSDANNAFVQLKTAPNAPVGCRGPNSAYNNIVFTSMNLNVAGYSNTGSVYFGVWNSSGSANRYASGELGSAGMGAVYESSNVPNKSHTVPIANRIALSGGTNYYFGVHNENSGGITVERETNGLGSQNVGLDESHANPNSALDGFNSAFRTSTSMIGSIGYIHLPSKPLTPSATSGGKKQITVSWTAPADDGDSAIDGYLLSWKKSSDSIWTSGPSTTSLSYTITGLDANTTYNVRVAARNAASDVISYDNVNNVHSDYSDVVTATTAPGGPPVWSGTTWAASEAFVCTSDGTWTGAAAAELYVCTSTTPSVVWTPVS